MIMEITDTDEYRLINFSFVANPFDKYAVIRISLWQKFVMWCSKAARVVSSWTR